MITVHPGHAPIDRPTVELDPGVFLVLLIAALVIAALRGWLPESKS